MGIAQPAIARLKSRPLWTSLEPADIAAICCIVLALWIVYFREFPNLGLYNDDYFNVAFPASMTFGEVWKQCLVWLTEWPNGRPLSACFGWLTSFMLVHMAGLQAVYLLPFSLVSANSALIYYIVSRKTQPLAGFIAAISYAISPVDTLRLNYTAAFQYQACITLTLAAFTLYIRQKHVLAYVTLLTALLFHECAILGFLAAPILSARRGELLKGFLKNAVIVGCLIGAVLYVRAEWMIEPRTLSTMANPANVLRRSLESAVLGPLTHLRLLEERAVQPITRPLITQVKGTLAWLLVVLAAGMAVIVAGGRTPRRGQWKTWLQTDELPDRGVLVSYARVLAAGIVIFVVNYLVFFLDPYYPANHIVGMIALVHTAPGIGASFLIAILMMVLVTALARIKLRFVGLAGALIYLSSLGAWGDVIRGQYIESWRNQKLFWKHMTALVPDATDGTVILVPIEKPSDLPYTWVIPSNSWADAVVPRMLYRCSWNAAPMLYVVPPSWTDRLENRNGDIGWVRPPSLGIPAWEPLPKGNVVVIVAKEGRLTRLEGLLKVPQGVLPLKPIPPTGTAAQLVTGVISRSILQ